MSRAKVYSNEAHQPSYVDRLVETSTEVMEQGKPEKREALRGGDENSEVHFVRTRNPRAGRGGADAVFWPVAESLVAVHARPASCQAPGLWEAASVCIAWPPSPASYVGLLLQNIVMLDCESKDFGIKSDSTETHIHFPPDVC